MTARESDGLLREPLPPGEPDACARFLVGFALLAPSVHDTQPWRFEVAGGAVRLTADGTRQQHAADPDGRELYMSVGCALENLLVAAERFGLRHNVSYFPSAERPALAAVVTLGAGGAPTQVRANLSLEAMRARRTARSGFRIVSVPPEMAWQLQSVALERHVRLDLTGNAAVKRALADLTALATRRLGGDPAWRREFAGQLNGGELHVPRIFGPLARGALRSLNLGPALARRDQRRIAGAPLIGLVSTHADNRLAWVQSGQLLERVWLAAAALGLSLQPLNAALQLTDTRAEVAKLLAPSGFHPQAVIRLGYAMRIEAPRSRRRPLEDVLT